jgi:multidrug efflux system membrane fusion protein
MKIHGPATPGDLLKPKRAILFAASLGLAGLALGGAAFAQTPAPAETAPAPSQAAPTGIPVTTTHARKMDFPVYLRGLGQVQASASVLVRARVDGALMEVPVTEGQTVKQGDLIAVIDPRPFKAALDQAQAKKAQDQALLANAKLDQARYTSLAKQDFASRQQVDTQQATVGQFTAAIAGDDAAIENAKLNLSFCYITSPIPGRVGLRLIDPGNMIRSADGAGIISINQLQPITATFTLPQDTLPRIQAAMAAGKLTVLAFSGDDRTLLDQGTLLTPDNAIDPATGTIKLKASFPNANNALWPGQFVNSRLLVETLVNAITVPTAAIQHGPSGLYVYAIKPDQTVARLPVEVTSQDGGLSVVAKGLDADAVVVTDGQSRLQIGLRVAATEMKTPPPGPAKPAGPAS